MKNKWLLTCALILLSSQTFASEYIACGEKTGDTEQNCFTCGTTCTARLDNKGTLTFAGSGKMNHFNITPAPWSSKNIAKTIKKAVFEEGITSLGEKTFDFYASFPNLTEIILPQTLTAMSNYGVAVTNVAGLVIPESVISYNYHVLTNFKGIAFCAEGKESVCIQGTKADSKVRIGTYKRNEDGTITCWRDDKENNIKYYYDSKGTLLKSHKKNANGSVSIYDKNGKLIPSMVKEFILLKKQLPSQKIVIKTLLLFAIGNA